MREILFRGKQFYNGRWIHGGLVERDGRVFIVGVSSLLRIDGIEVDPKTVGQFTGMTDKNGVKIWENDIVQGCFRSNHSKQTFRVAFDDGMFLFDNNCVEMPKYGVYGMRVIGNIFDNPELMEGGEADET